MRNRLWAVMVCIGLVMLGCLSPLTGAQAASGCSVPTTGALTTGELPPGSSVAACQAVHRLVKFGGVAVEIPDPGHVRKVYEDRTDGATEFAVAVSVEGEVSYPTMTVESTDGSSFAPPDEPSGLTPTEAQANSTTGCGLTAYTLNDWIHNSAWHFHRGDGGTPGGITHQQFSDVMVQAAANITTGRSPCDSEDRISATYVFEGPTTKESNFDSTDSCQDHFDGVSTVDFNPITKSTVVGITCIDGWLQTNGPDIVTEADVRLDKDNHGWTLTPGNYSECLGYKYDIQSVLTHEFGHVYGLNHSPDEYATMYKTMPVCSKYPRTLAGGDLRGLRILY